MIERVLKRIPISMALIGKRRSGKTHLLIKMLNSKYFRDTFEKIYIFSPTIELDPTWQKVRNIFDSEDTRFTLFDKFEPDVLEAILELQKKTIPKKRSDILIIIDDFAEKLKGQRGNILELLATKGRHFKASFIFTSQKYNSIHPIIRNNADEFVFFRVSNNLELKTIVDENDNKDLQKIGGFESLLNNNTKDYDYLLVVKGKEDKYYRGNALDFVNLKIQ